jgi:DNA-binding MarR family transcriptional regulator
MKDQGAAQSASEVWLAMSDLVLDQLRRRAVSDATGLSFGKARALRTLARHPMSMSELADALDIEKPNATTVVAELEAAGLVRRRPHPTDGRAKLADVTARGRALARRANKILATPPPGLTALSSEQLTTLARILERISGDSPQ